MFVFLWKLSVDYPFTSNIRVFKRFWITHILNVEIVDHPPFVEVFDLHISLVVSISREEIVSSMEEVFVSFRHMQ
jgi:hypothetical protein